MRVFLSRLFVFHFFPQLRLFPGWYKPWKASDKWLPVQWSKQVTGVSVSVGMSLPRRKSQVKVHFKTFIMSCYRRFTSLVITERLFELVDLFRNENKDGSTKEGGAETVKLVRNASVLVCYRISLPLILTTLIPSGPKSLSVHLLKMSNPNSKT